MPSSADSWQKKSLSTVAAAIGGYFLNRALENALVTASVCALFPFVAAWVWRDELGAYWDRWLPTGTLRRSLCAFLLVGSGWFALAMASVFLSQDRPPRRDLTVKEAQQSVITGKKFHILDLMENGKIANKRLVDCELWGPAVLAPTRIGNIVLGENQIYGGRESDSVVIVDSRVPLPMFGVVPIDNLTILGCKLHYIQFVVTAAEKEDFLKEIRKPRHGE